MNKPLILVVEDDPAVARLISTTLETRNYQYHRVQNGAGALLEAASARPDVILLDLGLPDMDGIAMCRRIRETNNIPIIMVSAKTQDIDKIVGLSTGADDYVAKPFNPLELMARVKSQLRRYRELNPSKPHERQEVISLKHLEINKVTHQVVCYGESIKLTPIEYNILLLLVRNQGRVFSINQIYESIWEEEAIGADNTVAVHIRHIREKIEINPKEPRYLKVVWGVGYKIEKQP